MKKILLITFLLLSLSLTTYSQEASVQARQPDITFFESVDTIREFMSKKTKFDYSDRNLIEVSLKFIDGHPRKGEAWVYRFGHKIPKRGNDLSIFHFTDGEIIEFHHGP
ncbi:hypothetical protein P3T73_06065 [Kiritimatiellota bacterium B12222]|nr:hypothetical protein P3T73_06065 [Kiritimatiellota bacterium B12222]